MPPGYRLPIKIPFRGVLWAQYPRMRLATDQGAVNMRMQNIASGNPLLTQKPVSGQGLTLLIGRRVARARLCRKICQHV
jgi:hypothetical protein